MVSSNQIFLIVRQVFSKLDKCGRELENGVNDTRTDFVLNSDLDL